MDAPNLELPDLAKIEPQNTKGILAESWSRTTGPFCVYLLLDPIGGEIRYVGTTNKPKRRLYMHAYRAKQGVTNMPVYNLFRELMLRGLSPQMKIIGEYSTREECWGAEKAWIKKLRSDHNLLNATDGGEGPNGYSLNETQRAKLKAALTGRKLSPEHCEAIRRSQIGRVCKPRSKPMSEYTKNLHRARMRGNKYRLGKGHTPELCARWSAMRKGRIHTPAAIEKMRIAATGRKLTAEDKAKISASRKALGFKPTPEQVAKLIAMNIARTGYRQTEETKAKIRATKAAKKHEHKNTSPS